MQRCARLMHVALKFQIVIFIPRPAYHASQNMYKLHPMTYELYYFCRWKFTFLEVTLFKVDGSQRTINDCTFYYYGGCKILTTTMHRSTAGVALPWSNGTEFVTISLKFAVTEKRQNATNLQSITNYRFLW